MSVYKNENFISMNLVIASTKVASIFQKTTSVFTPLFAATSIAMVTTMMPAQASTLSFEYQGSDAGGTGKAEMYFNGSGTTNLTVDIFNLSPITLDDGTGDNAPAITKFGFSALEDPQPNIVSWTLTAFDENDTLITIGSSDGSGTGDWDISIDDKIGNIKFDYLSEIQNVKGGLYNPDATAGLAAQPNYFTEATLDIEFDSAFTLDETSTLVRMQNVGDNGGGSLKLAGTPLDPNPPRARVPEPSTILGYCVVLGLGAMSQKKYSKKA